MSETYPAMTNAKLLETAQAVTVTLYELAEEFKINTEDLADVAAIAAANIAFAAHGIAGIEKLRTAADAMERDVMTQSDKRSS